MKKERKTFDVVLDDGIRLRVQKPRIKHNTYQDAFNQMLNRETINGDIYKCNWAMKKIDYIRWITDGDFNFKYPCSIYTLMYYGDIKYKRMYLDDGWTDAELSNFDNVFYMTEGLYTTETIPKDFLVDDFEKEI